MGCVPSKGFGSSQPIKSVQPIRKAHPLVTEEAGPMQKVKTTEALRKNDPYLVTKALETIRVQENLRTPGENYTLLHASAEFDADQSIKLCLDWLNKNENAQARAIINITDPEGRTPAMLAAYRDATRAFKAILESGLVDLEVKDIYNKDIRALCKENSLKCLEILDQYQGKAPQADDINKNVTVNNNNINNNQNNVVKDNQNNVVKDNINNNQNNVIKDDQKKPEIKPQIQDIKPQIQEIKTHNIDKSKVDVKPEIQKPQPVQQPLNDPILNGLDPNSKIYNILKDLIAKNGVFKDPEFPATLASITKNTSHKYYTKFFSKAVWKRPHEIFGCDYDQIKVFDGIDPGDISQGILGVCYFLCSLAAIAEYPSRLVKTFLTKEANKYGAYAVQFYVQGIPVEVVVDDQIPCYDFDAKKPLFSKPKGKELWTLIMEKAWAKLYGSYTVTEAGHSGLAIEYLLACPTKGYFTKDLSEDKIWEQLLHADKNKYIMTTSTYSNANEDMGLVPGHAYSIISVHNVQGKRILKIRNPWGYFEWKGAWSDNSPLWTDSIKQEVGFVTSDDGIFFMDISDFKKNFEHYVIACYHENWHYTYVVGSNHPRHAVYYKFTVKENCEAFFRIHQKDKRFSQADGDEEGGKKYSPASFRVCRVENNGMYSDVLPDPNADDNDALFGRYSIYNAKDKQAVKLTPGNYIVRVKVRWVSGQEEQFTLSAYASSKITFEKSEKIKDFYYHYYMYHGAKGKKQDMKNGCIFTSGYLGDHMFCYYENNGTRTWNLDITFKDMKNLRVARYNRTGENQCKFSVPPGGKEVVVVKKIDPPKACSNSWEWKHNWS